MIISLMDAANIKKEMAESYAVQLHFHDGCGGQYFSIDNPTEEVKKYITEFFNDKKIKVCFSENGEYFSLEEIS